MIHSNNTTEEVNKLTGKLESTKALEKAGHLDTLSIIMNNVELRNHMMNKYDLSWSDTDYEFNENITFWRSMLNYAQKTAGISEDVVKAIFTHIVDMSNCREKNKSNKEYGITDDDITEVNEPVYGYGEEFDESWHSIRRDSVRPRVGDKVLIAGWFYTGVIEYTVAMLDTHGEWMYQFNGYNKPEYTPLYWRRLPEAPDEIMKESPEEL